MAEVRVSDAGDGVEAEVLPRLFERFATGDSIGGTGLGLFIVRELARASGGDAYYEPSSDEQPSGTFVLSLPLRLTQTSFATSAAARSPARTAPSM